jgi:hypothetical protein
MVLFVLPSVSHYTLSGNIGIFRLQSIAFKHDFIFKEAEFDLEPLMFNEALLLISPGCVENMGSSIKDCFFLRE